MRFRLITYNIHKAVGTDRCYRPDRIIALLRYYRADIVLLQEMEWHASRSADDDPAVELARTLGYEHHVLSLNVVLKRGKYGNATLSRFPIVSQRNIDLTVGWRKKRGAQHTRIALSAGHARRELDVFNVHLGLSARERKIQIRRLLESSDVSQVSEDRPCIIAGDMNDWRHVLNRRLLRPAGFSCGSNRRSDSRWSIRTFPSFAPTGGLDKIFYRGPLRLLHVYRSRLKLARVASDHIPLIADFEITG